jgi:hypothetical protein
MKARFQLVRVALAVAGQQVAVERRMTPAEFVAEAGNRLLHEQDKGVYAHLSEHIRVWQSATRAQVIVGDFVLDLRWVDGFLRTTAGPREIRRAVEAVQEANVRDQNLVANIIVALARAVPGLGLYDELRARLGAYLDPAQQASACRVS